jgi:AhpD family alkylhydroperoxidase
MSTILIRSEAYACARCLDKHEGEGRKSGVSAKAYQDSARRLEQIFASAPSRYTFSDLLLNSPAAREMSASIELAARLLGRESEYPELDELLSRL